MFTVYFARGYVNQERIAECRTLSAAMIRADEEYANGARDIAVYNAQGDLVYEPQEEDYLIDEY